MIRLLKNSVGSTIVNSSIFRALFYKYKLSGCGQAEINHAYFHFNRKEQIKFSRNIIGEPYRSGEPPVRISLQHKASIFLSDNAFIRRGVNIELSGCSSLHIGKRSYLNRNAVVSAGGSAKVVIGDDCAIAWNVQILAYDFHCAITEDGSDSSYFDDIILGNNVWIGAGAIILKGAKINDHSIVAAGAVVLKGQYPAYSLIAGNPGRVVKSNIDWRHLTDKEKRAENIQPKLATCDGFSKN